MQRRAALVGAGALVVALTAAGLWLARSDGAPAGLSEAEAYLDAWTAADWPTMATGVDEPPQEFESQHASAWSTLGVLESRFAAGEPDRDGDDVVVPFSAGLTLRGLGEWEYQGELPLRRIDGEWLVRWEPAVIHPALEPGLRFVRIREQGPRAQIHFRDGQPLASGGPGEQGRVGLLAALTLGETGPLAVGELADRGPTYEAGDTVGLGGLEAAYDERLSGSPSGVIRVVDDSGAEVELVHRFEATRPEPLIATLDLATQASAEQALAGLFLPAAIVAVDIESGAVRAAANTAASGFDRALTGRYPPGSSFKIVTASALLARGVKPDDLVRCPSSAQSGDSRVFRNYQNKDLGLIPFIDSFAQSCNTTFVLEAGRLGDALLAEAARFGFNLAYASPVVVAGGSFPIPGNDTEFAAAAIGQGRVEASPLHMATVAAAAASGSWRAPFLAAETGSTGEPRPLDDASAVALPDFMRAVVTDGTGLLADVDGLEVAGKTGTAEFGTEEPPDTHAWFVGFSDGLAFAVIVEGGGVGGDVAAPLAVAFLDALPRPEAPPPSTTTESATDG